MTKQHSSHHKLVEAESIAFPENTLEKWDLIASADIFNDFRKLQLGFITAAQALRGVQFAAICFCLTVGQ